MDDTLPIRYTQAFKLTDLGLSTDLFKPGNLGFESEKYISMKEGGVSSYIYFQKIHIFNHFVSYALSFCQAVIYTFAQYRNWSLLILAQVLLSVEKL